MGNQLVGIAPSQIFPVEHYLTDHSDLQFDIRLVSQQLLLFTLFIGLNIYRIYLYSKLLSQTLCKMQNSTASY